jgi:phage shock protein PspC (stress-responsive transcriptional regulator)
MNTTRRLTRSNTDRIIAGVAGGVANYLDVDPTLVRLGFVLLVLVGGVSPLLYLLLWAVLPNENSANQNFGQQIRANIAEMEQRATQVANQVSNQVNHIMGSEQARTVNQSTPPQSTGQAGQHEGPATGPTQRL